MVYGICDFVVKAITNVKLKKEKLSCSKHLEYTNGLMLNLKGKTLLF